MKILHVANFSLAKYGAAFYSVDRKLSWGLTKNGHFVYDFSYRDVARFESPFGGKFGGVNRMCLRLMDCIESFKPEVILFGHTELIEGSIFAEIRQKYPHIFIGMWYVDLITEKKKENIVRKVPFIDAFFATSAGAALSQFRSVTSAALCYFPNVCSLETECGRAFDVFPHYDFCFMGTPSTEREQLKESILSGIPELRCGFFGEKNNRVMGSKFVDVISHSAMSVNLSRNLSVPLYTSDRVAQLMGNGVLTFTPEIPEMSTLIPEDCWVQYADLAELVELIKRYARDEEARRVIAKLGHSYYHEKFNAVRVTEWMLKTIVAREADQSVEWAKFCG